MNTTTARSLGVAVSAAALAATALVGAAHASVERASPHADRPSWGTSSSSSEAANPQVDRERGIVLEGYGELDGRPVLVTVYENQRYGNSVQVVVGDPEDDGAFGTAEQTAPFVVDGVLAVTVTIDGAPLEITGTVTESGRPERTTESLEDAGTRIVSRGTHQALAVDATVAYEGSTARLAFDAAFAYDLEVRKVPLYGSGR